jgi:hypothetical protein
MAPEELKPFGWTLWGALLLTIPIAFVIGALTGHTPYSSSGIPVRLRTVVAMNLFISGF